MDDEQEGDVESRDKTIVDSIISNSNGNSNSNALKVAAIAGSCACPADKLRELPTNMYAKLFVTTKIKFLSTKISCIGAWGGWEESGALTPHVPQKLLPIRIEK